MQGFMLGAVVWAVGFAGAEAPTLRLDDPQGRLIVALPLNGNGPFRWLLDTHSVTSVIDTALADRIGLEAGERWPAAPAGADVRWRRGARLEGLGEPIELRAVGQSLQPLRERLGVPVDGLLGYDVLRQFAIAVDPARRTVRFLDRATRASLASSDAIPWRLDGGRPRVRARLIGASGRPLPLEPFLETGTSEVAILDGNTAHRLGRSVSIQVGTTEHGGLEIRGDARRGPDSAGLGLGYLRRQPFVLDYPGSKLILGQPYPPGFLR